MSAPASLPRRWRDRLVATTLLQLVLLLSAAAAQAAEANHWRDNVGQMWVWNTSSHAGEALGGTWWAHSLEPGKRYQIEFEVRDLRGDVVLLLADEPAISIDGTGTYQHAFTVAVDQGKRRMMFQARTANALLSAGAIVVSEVPEPVVSEPDSSTPLLEPQGNVWKNSFGQQWFFQTSASAGQLLAGTWWEAALYPGRTYRIAFDVSSIRGTAGVLVGDNQVVDISAEGSYSFDFHIAEGGNRRMLFQSRTNDVSLSVNNIWVTEVWSAPPATGADSEGKGHYISFAQPRDLKADVLDPIQDPYGANSNYALEMAQQLDAALRTTGVAGIVMHVHWGELEVADGQYDWRLLDDNVEVARLYGLKFVVLVGDRSFDGSNPLPGYFPPEYVLPSGSGGLAGIVAKRWDPYVYERAIRLNQAIAARYGTNPGFGGIATSETATGYRGSDYSPGAYRHALTQVALQTQAALGQHKLFLYMNFLRGAESGDMNRDQRPAVVRDLPAQNLVIGGPDITPDVAGMPRSVTNYRLHVRRTQPEVEQFCHLQHVDHGHRGVNVKTNEHRQAYLEEIAQVRQREQESWFDGEPGVFELDDLRDPAGQRTELHPSHVLGQLWSLEELFAYGQRNFDCDYTFWHFREFPNHGEYGWPDTRSVILSNPYFYE